MSQDEGRVAAWGLVQPNVRTGDGGRRTGTQDHQSGQHFSNVTLVNEMALTNWTIMTGEGFVFWGVSTYLIPSDAGFTLCIQGDGDVAIQRLDLSTRIVDTSGWLS